MSLPKVLLLGDSIRMSYQPLVADRLAGKAEVVGPAVNGQFSLHTLASLGHWFETLGTPDVVHWNNGIHDAGHNAMRSPRQIPLDDYVGNLGHIIQRIHENRTKHLIFATSTPPHPDKPFDPDTPNWSWKHGDIERYNAAAVEVMSKHNVPVNDLYRIVAADPDRMLDADQLHLSDEGKARCADAVVQAVSAYL
jgi:lysophospholipase L1-like esterase